MNTARLRLLLSLWIGITLSAPAEASVLPRPKLVIPAGKEKRALEGFVLLAVQQLNPLVDSTEISTVIFEYSTDKVSWVPIDTTTQVSMPENEWVASWDVSGLSSGRYFVRVRMQTADAREGAHKIGVRVNKPPEPTVACQALGGGSVRFDGVSSLDSDGTINEWEWDFGDGTLPGVCSPDGFACFDALDCSPGGQCIGAILPSVATGAAVSHAYIDLNRTYSASLTVTDNRRSRASAHVMVSFDALGTAQCDVNPKCECKAMTLRKSGEALGPDGEINAQKGKDKHWQKTRDRFDGKKLGPLIGSQQVPGNPEAQGGDKTLGYAFEVVTRVDGDPSKCREIQWVKATFEINNEMHFKSWEGTLNDLDKDGMSDIEVANEQDCVKASGVWFNPTCYLIMPYAAGRYGPDEFVQSKLAHGPYEYPFTYKKHVAQKIIWVDAPSAKPKKGTIVPKYQADFVALVKGTDSKYCFTRFSMNADRSSLPETLTLNASGDRVTQQQLPYHGWHTATPTPTPTQTPTHTPTATPTSP